jgi:hypothetical protein
MKGISSRLSPLIAVNRKAPALLHRQIYDAYRTMIADGRLRPGQRDHERFATPTTFGMGSEFRILDHRGRL